MYVIHINVTPLSTYRSVYFLSIFAIQFICFFKQRDNYTFGHPSENLEKNQNLVFITENGQQCLLY